MKRIYTNIEENCYFKETNEEFLFNDQNMEWEIIKIYPDILYQTWYGFGGSFTEAFCYNIKKLDTVKYYQLLKDYFDKDGLDYSLCRIPIGSTDFSLSSHDYKLEEDIKTIIPVIKDALKYNDIHFLASPWTPPKEWKDNKKLIQGGKLLPSFYQNYAQYLLKFVEDYRKNGIQVDYMTIQNEPKANQRWESCLYTAKEEATLLQEYIIPTFKNSKVKFLIWDHNKDCIYERVKDTLSNNDLENKITGVAYHWYTGSHVQNLDLLKKDYPHLLLFHTESCCGFDLYDSIKWRKDAELIALDIVMDLCHGMNGYIDWNLVLDYNGGPNWANNYCKAPIILNKKANDYIKTPIYYYIGHFSKYIKEGYQIMGMSKYSELIQIISLRKDDSIVIVAINPFDFYQKYTLFIGNKIYHENLTAHSIVTYLFSLVEINL